MNDPMRARVDELVEGDFPDPPAWPRTFALTRRDLARLAGEAPPADDRSPLPVPPPVPSAIHRGSYADHCRQFPEASADEPTRPARGRTPPAR